MSTTTPESMSTNLATVTSIITCISASVSVISGLAILWSYRQVPHIQNYTRYLLLCLTIADIFTAYGNLISTVRWFIIGNDKEKNDTYCVAQSFITTTSTLSAFFWTTAIAIYIFSAIALRVNIAEKRTGKIMMSAIPILIPVTITVVALGSGVLGEDDYSGSGPWCWIKSDVSNNVMWKLVTGKAWEVMTYMVTLVLYILIKFSIWRENRRRGRYLRWSEADNRLRDEDAIFGISWLFLVIARIWGTLRFFKQVFDVQLPQRVADILLYLQCVGDSSQAFWNFLFFFTFDPTLRQHVCPTRCFSSGERRMESMAGDLDPD
ncbi:G-protein coupled receptor 157-like [Mizuhopecten yessoensis]|uniref:G-protein coupled receptor 157 n=1 Tax=Mizuhopecten yessoensis TaxID=6573 RepID=A0A210PY86_MIZYE|nr:G-protein coupled receptor 157-like [Mizuhopecten yessoensis]OWF41447.1 G-protein coupled receptor 157 [Mizuhopecten yessoensis]